MYALKQEQATFAPPKRHLPLIDPNVIRAASQIYYTYCEVHPEIVGRATGVAISRVTHRGKVVFIEYPALLPQECFVPLSQIESYIY